MLEIIALVVLISSLAGISILIFQKAPLLLRAPESAPVRLSWKDLLLKIKTAPPFKDFSLENFFQKTLFKIRILTLKVDNKTSQCLQKLREKSKSRKFESREERDNYWQELKKCKKNQEKPEENNF